MDLDRGTLAKIDRKVLSGIQHDESYHMVRVSVSEATWSTWKRYCDAAGISMGRAIVALVEKELRSVVGELDVQPLFLAEFENGLAERQRALDVRVRQLAALEQRLQAQERRRIAAPIRPQVAALTLKVGRNDLCPCGSGLKYKRCHGET